VILKALDVMVGQEATVTQLDTSQRTVRVNAFGVRDFFFVSAIVLMNFTLLRPSPVDLAFVTAAAFSIFCNQYVTRNFFILTGLLVAFIISTIFSSLHLLGSPEIELQLLIKCYVVLLAPIACYVTMTWDEAHWERFLKVAVVAYAIAGLLGTFGFFTQNALLTWDGRGKGLLDDPNMYASFLNPGVLICMYLLQKRFRLWIAGALVLILLGILCSFSRAGIGALLVCGTLYLVFLNRNNMTRAVLWVMLGVMLTLVMACIGMLVFSEFADKLADRLTFAKSYDLGHGGRYDRYFMAIPLILDNPAGIGMLEYRKYFDEPIHNIFLGAFLYYGWVAGLAWLSAILLSVRLAWRNWVETQSPIAVLLSFSFFSLVLCASLHEGEHWRHLWLFLGLLWGFNPTLFRRPAFQGWRLSRRPANPFRNVSSAPG
jgi:hypothetical protein